MKSRGSARDPLWYKDAIIYETHVKAFFDSNNDGIGDFKGLIQKLDYLAELGVTCLWLLPFFPSPLRDDGYDIADYTNVHPGYGSMDDFKTFMQAAHERDLQVLIELVVNHTSDQHPWFQRARTAPLGSSHRDYYVWSETDQKYRDARIIFTDTEKSNWAWDPEAKAYYWHRFFSHQPDLNFDNPAVLKEVVEAMRFWLDLGVDAMRLDAIPYLVEREGTNCENLLDTHAAIKQIRRELDASYSHRMLLAEANQWPSDVRHYFGDGDECHMAFHFPLMPRIFMALRLEDRHPITEIMRQTPDIPDGCQWGLFLRNHDELTLEMVTDEERDYMYLAYSADPRMRINVGIRRRLAPLMDNNRRRIELMNSLLFSFPGTPIIYYGDEIGMGDNVHLGDRNGVRTPMQWSADRNAGFSRANPANLYSPVIMDPVYGYEAINVEAQLSDASSLLHWMRNMISLRKLFRVFGRGTLEFLNPENRKVIAYIRKYEGDHILCVANLSRFAQPVELDLSALAGMTPVEMLGFTEFPTIRKEPYRLTLGPYSYFWFEMQGAPEPIEIRTPALVVDSDSLAIQGEWTGIFDQHAARHALESTILPEFIARQRWFGGKARGIASTRILDWSWIVTGPELLAIALVEVTDPAGNQDTYQLPLGITFGPAADALRETQPDAVLCEIRNTRETGLLHEGMATEANCLALLNAIRERAEWKSQRAVLRAFPVGADGSIMSASEQPLKATRGTAEQSNTSILFGGRYILKLFRKLAEGPNPDFEIGRFLAEQTEFRAIPALLGGMEYTRPGSPDVTLGMLQVLVQNQGDGWKRTLEELSRYYELASTARPFPEELAARSGSLIELSSEDIPAEAREVIGIYLESAATLGRRTAEMHAALATPTDDEAFRPAPLTRQDLEKLSESLSEHAGRMFDLLKTKLSELPDEFVDRAALALGQRRRLLARLRALTQLEPDMVQIRIHGDYHLGQVLWVENDFVILDFEGEPARPLAERRGKKPPMQDVAGMLRSFSYAAYASLLNYTARGPEEFERLERWAVLWERWTSAAFLRAYREAASPHGFLPKRKEAFQTLLDALLLDKALYELGYELNNRPAWARIPLRGILNLAQ